ncbi:hypothetical protein Tco_0302235, partial [Tanacetum coccineum]
MWETNSYKAHKDQKKMDEALEKSMDHDHSDLWLKHEERRKRDIIHQKHHLGLHLISHPLLHHLQAHLELQEPLKLLDRAPSSSKTAASAEYTAWTTTNTRLKASVLSIPEDLHMDADSALDEQVHSFDDEDIGNDHIPK